MGIPSKKIWAIGDLHLSFGIANKSMDIFGENWFGHAEKIASLWRKNISQEDLVLIPGDISWAMHLEEAKIDLEWIQQLPGTKVMIRGNHDYWWSSVTKIRAIMPLSIFVIQNDAFEWNNISIAGARLWDTQEYNFDRFIEMKGEKQQTKEVDWDEKERIYTREINRLEMSLKCLNQDPNKMRIVMTHYPPIGPDLQHSRVSALLEKYHVSICVFGHLHNVRDQTLPFGEKNGVRYYLTSCDYLNFAPLEIPLT